MNDTLEEEELDSAAREVARVTEEEAESTHRKFASWVNPEGKSIKDPEVATLVSSAVKRFEWVVSFMALTDHFNFEIVHRLQKKASLAIPTMGVRPSGIVIEMTYNPLFVDTLTDAELRYALAHEVLHIVLHHITKRAASDRANHELDNYAADYAINCLLPSTGDRCYPFNKEDRKDAKGNVVGKKGEPWILLPLRDGLPDKLSREQYLLLLQDKYKDRCPKCGGKLGGEGKGEGEGDGGEEGGSDGGCSCGCGGDPRGSGQLGDHSGWDKNDLADSQVREWVERVNRGNKWGTLSAETQELILAAQRTEVKWTALLKHYYGQISTASRRSSYKRPSRRMWYPWSGKVRETKDRKLVGIDDSGSVSSKLLAKFLAETNKLAEVQPVDMITWDAGLTMAKAVPWDRRKKTHAFTGRGGTDPQPCLDYAEKNGYKQVIMLTDGYFGTPRKPNGVSVLWVISADGTTDNCPFGTVIKMQNHTD